MPFSPKRKVVLEKEDVLDMIGRARMEFDEGNKFNEVSSLISFLWLSGVRISEALAVKKEDVKVDREYLYVTITPLKRWRKTKEGIKKDLFQISLPLPRKNSIFAKLIINHLLTLQSDQLMWDMDRRTAWRKITKLNPKIHLHTFRHSRATHFSNKGITEEKMKKWFGWAKGSPMASRYVNYSRLEMMDMTKIIEAE